MPLSLRKFAAAAPPNNPMLTPRAFKIHRALICTLQNVPDVYLLPEQTLYEDTARAVLPRATQAEFDQELRRAEREGRIIGLVSPEEGTKWRITEVGKLWLAEHA
jgi:hypothetical protein